MQLKKVKFTCKRNGEFTVKSNVTLQITVKNQYGEVKNFIQKAENSIIGTISVEEVVRVIEENELNYDVTMVDDVFVSKVATYCQLDESSISGLILNALEEMQ